MAEKYILIVNKGFKGKLVTKRKEFMDLLIRVLGDSEEASNDMAEKFGTEIVGNYNSSNSITIMNDGEVTFKD